MLPIAFEKNGHYTYGMMKLKGKNLSIARDFRDFLRLFLTGE